MNLVTCPRCKARIQISEDTANGAQIQCPGCFHAFWAETPVIPEAKSLPSSQDSRVRFACPFCNQHYAEESDTFAEEILCSSCRKIFSTAHIRPNSSPTENEQKTPGPQLLNPQKREHRFRAEWFLAAAVVLIAVLVGALFLLLYHADTLLLRSIPVQITETEAVPAPAPVILPPPPAKKAVEAVPTKQVSRQNLLDDTEELLSLYRTDPEKNWAAFLKESEVLFKKFGLPRTNEEKIALHTLHEVYTPLYEQKVLIPAKEAKAAAAAFAAVRKLSAEAGFPAAASPYAPDAIRKVSAEADRLCMEQLLSDRKGHLKKLNEFFLLQRHLLLCAFLESIQRGDRQILQKRKTLVENTPVPDGSAAAEREKFIAEFSKFRAGLLQEAEALHTFRHTLGRIDQRTYIRIYHPIKEEILDITCAIPGNMKCKSNSAPHGRTFQLTSHVQSAFFAGIRSLLKTGNTPVRFYFFLMSGKNPGNPAQSNEQIPLFWHSCWKELLPYLK